MFHWNVRIVDMSHENLGDPWFEVREVSYDEDTGEPDGHGEPCMGAESPEAVVALLQQMIDDIKTNPSVLKGDEIARAWVPPVEK